MSANSLNSASKQIRNTSASSKNATFQITVAWEEWKMWQYNMESIHRSNLISFVIDMIDSIRKKWHTYSVNSYSITQQNFSQTHFDLKSCSTLFYFDTKKSNSGAGQIVSFVEITNEWNEKSRRSNNLLFVELLSTKHLKPIAFMQHSFTHMYEW